MYLDQLNASSASLSLSLTALTFPLDDTQAIVYDLTDANTGLAALDANLTTLTDPASLPSPATINNTVGIDAPDPSNSTLMALLSGRLDDAQVIR